MAVSTSCSPVACSRKILLLKSIVIGLSQRSTHRKARRRSVQIRAHTHFISQAQAATTPVRWQREGQRKSSLWRWGRQVVMLFDVAKVAKMKDEDVLSKLAYEAQQVKRYSKSRSRIISYLADNNGIMAWRHPMASKRTNTMKGAAKAGLTLVGNISMKSNGHFFVFGIVANDVELF